MIKIDDRNIKQLERDLKTFAKKAYPFATKATLNGQAFKARGLAQGIIKRDMISRNKFTVNSIRVEMTKTLNVKRQMSVMGSIAPYMETQEFGGTKRKKGKHGVPIATSYAAGQSEDSRPRVKLPRRPNQLKNIRLHRRSKKKSLVGIVKGAVESGNKYVFMDLGRRKGIFKIAGGKRNPKVKMVWSLTNKSVRVPRSPWMQPAVKRTEPFTEGIYRDALNFQLKRLGLQK